MFTVRFMVIHSPPLSRRRAHKEKLMRDDDTPDIEAFAEAHADLHRVPDVARCHHKFIDSTVCLKCGWKPPAVPAPEPKARA
jgi:hypothetical protein